MTSHLHRRAVVAAVCLAAGLPLARAGEDAAFPLPLTNNHSGISVALSGANGRDWAVERTVHDDLIAEQVIYLKADVAISLAHNERNTFAPPSSRVQRLLGVDGADGRPNSGDEGAVHVKIDRDLQSHPYVGATPAWAPLYSEPFSFANLTYDGSLPVLGAVGDNGGPWGSMPGRAAKRFAYGQKDDVGNEWHTLTWWDDDTALFKSLGLRGRSAASDGHCQFICVNPVAPVIQMKADDGAQFYTTPIKTYHVPRIWTQTTYLTPGVKIHFVNLTNDEPIFYRVEDNNFHQYDGVPVDADDIFMPKTDDEPSVLAVKCGENGPVLLRRVVFDPNHPAYDEEHGRLLWADDDERERAVKRLHTVSPFKESYRSFRGSFYQSSGAAFGAARGGWRSGASEASRALANALVAAVEGPDAAPAEARLAKQRLLRLARLQPVGFELNVQNITPAKDFISELGQTTQLYADAAVAYDLLIARFRSYDHPDGITAVEEFLIRDNLAKIAKSILQFRGNYSFTSGGGDTHWAHGFELALGATALAMPTYASPCYGVSGGDRATVNDLADSHGKFWNPFPDQPVTWYAAATDPAIATPGHPNVIAPFRAEFLLTDDGWWTGPNDLQGDGSRYVKGPRGNKLADVKYGGLANAENRIELVEMSGYESPFVLRVHAFDLMRRLAGDEARPTCVTNYIRRRMVGGVVRLRWNADNGTYTPAAPDTGCLAAFNRHYPFAALPASRQRVKAYLDSLTAYYAGEKLDPALRKRLADTRKRMFNPYVLACCEAPDELPAPAVEATEPPILKPMFKYVVAPGATIVKPLIAIDPNGGEATLTVENLPAGASFDPAARTITWTPGEADLGVHVVAVTAANARGAVTRPMPILVKADPGAGPIPAAPKAVTATLSEDKKTVQLNWAPAAADTDVAAYVVYRDGALWAITDAKTTNFLDTERVEPLSHTRYHVAVYSKIGAESTAAPATPNPIFVNP